MSDPYHRHAARQQASGAASHRKVPDNWFESSVPTPILQHIEKHQLGSVQEIYTQQAKKWAFIITGGLLFLSGLYLTIYSLQFIHPGVAINGSLLIFIACFLVPGAALLIIAWFSQLVGYECRAGFLLFDKRTRRIVLTVRWEQLVQTWTETRANGKSRSTIYYIIYRSADGTPQTESLPFRNLWVQCALETGQRRSVLE